MASLKDRIAAAKAAAEAAEAVVASPEFAAEESARAELDALREREQAAHDRKRSADLAGRMDFWRDVLGEGPELRSVRIAEKPHDFVIAAGGGAAYREWQKGLSDVAMGKIGKGSREKVDANEVTRKYAVAGILDWNGKILDERGGEVDSETGKALNDLLRNESAIASEIMNVVLRLDGAASDERKS